MVSSYGGDVGRIGAAALGELELLDARHHHLLADVARLVEIPLVDLLGLGREHRLNDVVVLDVADPQEGGQDRHGDGDEAVELRVLLVLRGVLLQLFDGLQRIDVECQRVLLLGVRGFGFCASAECARCRCGNQAVRKGGAGGAASAFAAAARRAAASRSALR